jgi:AcrR family transcriptional regulator
MAQPQLDDTKERILATAERLFADRGFAETPLRAVTTAAGVNIAAVNYHFGSKEGLQRAVVRRVMAVVVADRTSRLAQLREQSGSDLEDLLAAMVDPMLDAFHEPERGSTMSRLVARVLSDPAPEVQQAVADEVGDVEKDYLELLSAHLPHLSPVEVAWRFRAMIGVFVITGLSRFGLEAFRSIMPADPDADDRDVERRRMLTLMIGALEAPAA